MVLSYLFEARVLALYRAVATRVLRHTELRIKLDRAVEEFLSGLRGISSVGELLGVCLWSVLIWLCYGGAYHLGLHAFGLDAPFWVALAVNVMIALAVAAPSAPGFIGTFQAGCYVALVTVYKQPPEFALAYAIVVHAVQLLAMVVCGFLSLTGRGMGLRSLRPPTA
jgi:uncharacterized membrane protein YbhN (UPF0104 family)